MRRGGRGYFAGPVSVRWYECKPYRLCSSAKFRNSLRIIFQIEQKYGGIGSVEWTAESKQNGWIRNENHVSSNDFLFRLKP